MSARALRTFVVSALVSVAALVFSGGALALDHVSIKTHAIALSARTSTSPICKKGQKSSSRHPCRKRPRHLGGAQVRENPPISGWKFGLEVNSNPDGTWRLGLTFDRATGNVDELHNYSFTLPASAVSVSSNLSAVTLDSGTQMGPFGVVKLTFTSPGPLVAGTPGFGCGTTGTWQMRTGKLLGQVHFSADNTYFNTVIATALTADVNANTGAPPTCANSTPVCAHVFSIAAQSAAGTPILYVTNTAIQQGVSLLEFFSVQSGPASIAHSLTEKNLPVGDLTVAADLSSGSATATGASRFTGSLSFKASGSATAHPFPTCGAAATYSIAFGTTSGGIAGRFLAIPAPPAPGGAMSFSSTNSL